MYEHERCVVYLWSTVNKLNKEVRNKAQKTMNNVDDDTMKILFIAANIHPFHCGCQFFLFTFFLAFWLRSMNVTLFMLLFCLQTYFVFVVSILLFHFAAFCVHVSFFFRLCICSSVKVVHILSQRVLSVFVNYNNNRKKTTN